MRFALLLTGFGRPSTLMLCAALLCTCAAPAVRAPARLPGQPTHTTAMPAEIVTVPPITAPPAANAPTTTAISSTPVITAAQCPDMPPEAALPASAPPD